MFKKVLGTKDILPGEVRAWQDLENKCRGIFALYNYREIRTPLIEEASLYRRGLGDSTEIVGKQMFLIERGEDCYALRPEGTASVVRAYLENGLDKSSGFSKFFYIGAMFRAERPQKGRLRQFHHIGCEALGSESPELDAEIISLCDKLLRDCGVSGYSIQLNSLGCSDDKQRLSSSLKTALEPRSKDLCPECAQRLNSNVLRVLDCKNETCRSITAELNIAGRHLCPDCAAHFERVKKCLDTLGIVYTVSSGLVRGLDYYTRTVFEVTHPNMGAQNAIGAGGRYDGLIKELGGPRQGAAGFALGVERVLIALGEPESKENGPDAYFIALGDNARNECCALMHGLRSRGISADTDYEGRSIKGAMRQANSMAARYAVIVGDDELAKGVVLLKDMQNGSQEEINRALLAETIKERLKGNVQDA